MPTLEIMAELDWLLTDVTTSKVVPMDVYDTAIPGYLATGRPLKLLDMRYADLFAFDRMRTFLKSDIWLCERTLSGLGSGLAMVRLRRAQAHAVNDRGEASALGNLEAMIETDISEFTKAHAEHIKAADAARPKQRSSWVDAFALGPVPGDVRPAPPSSPMNAQPITSQSDIEPDGAPPCTPMTEAAPSHGSPGDAAPTPESHHPAQRAPAPAAVTPPAERVARPDTSDTPPPPTPPPPTPSGPPRISDRSSVTVIESSR
ncbi:MAG: hypothetical protein ACSHXD_20140, partial [Marinosulfonomonas sp.]